MGEPDIHLKVGRRYQDGFAPLISYAELPQPKISFLGPLVVNYRLFVLHAPRHGLPLKIRLNATRYA